MVWAGRACIFVLAIFLAVISGATWAGPAAGSTDADGVRIYGRYEAGTWGRTTSTSTVVNGQPEAALLNGAVDVVFQLVTLNGLRDGEKTAYGLRAINGSEVALIRTQSSAGAGGVGSSGSPGSTPGKADSGRPGISGPSDCNVAGAGGFGTQ